MTLSVDVCNVQTVFYLDQRVYLILL